MKTRTGLPDSQSNTNGAVGPFVAQVLVLSTIPCKRPRRIIPSPFCCWSLGRRISRDFKVEWPVLESIMSLSMREADHVHDARRNVVVGDKNRSRHPPCRGPVLPLLDRLPPARTTQHRSIEQSDSEHGRCRCIPVGLSIVQVHIVGDRGECRKQEEELSTKKQRGTSQHPHC